MGNEYFRPTSAIVNLGNYQWNLREIQRRIGKRCRVMAVVKAQGYGHGMLECARAAAEIGVKWFGVATVDEALLLRQDVTANWQQMEEEKHETREARKEARDNSQLLTEEWREAQGKRQKIEVGQSKSSRVMLEADDVVRILLMGPTFPADAEVLVENGIDVAVGSLAVAKALNKAAGKRQKTRGGSSKQGAGSRKVEDVLLQRNFKARAHLKVDTGMGRFGFWFEDVPEIVDELKKLENIEWVGLMTHFSESDSPNFTYTRWQIKNFNWLIKECELRGFRPQFIHAANSGAILQHPDAYYDMVRAGIMSYGMLPDVRTRRTIAIKPVMTLLTRIINVREVPAGRYLSYGRTYQTKRRTRVGILPLGYGDGYPRHFSNCGYVIVKGKKAPVIGRVCMDQVLIDITRIPEAQVGDEVLVYGQKGKDYIPIEEMAHRIGTISYELTCRLTARVPRIYVNS